jgi:hypothetical protein
MASVLMALVGVVEALAGIFSTGNRGAIVVDDDAVDFTIAVAAAVVAGAGVGLVMLLLLLLRKSCC